MGGLMGAMPSQGYGQQQAAPQQPPSQGVTPEQIQALAMQLGIDPMQLMQMMSGGSHGGGQMPPARPPQMPMR